MLTKDHECVVCGRQVDPDTASEIKHKEHHAATDTHVNDMNAPDSEHVATLWRAENDTWYTILPHGEYVPLTLDFWHERRMPRPTPEVAAIVALDKELKRRRIHSARLPMWPYTPKVPSPFGHRREVDSADNPS